MINTFLSKILVKQCNKIVIQHVLIKVGNFLGGRNTLEIYHCALQDIIRRQLPRQLGAILTTSSWHIDHEQKTIFSSHGKRYFSYSLDSFTYNRNLPYNNYSIYSIHYSNLELQAKWFWKGTGNLPKLKNIRVKTVESCRHYILS